MAKGDDAVMRKRNKARRKKQQNDSSNVSARIASIIAAKKRRLSGKRRQCQGMCFSLPTLDDPFNDRNGKPDLIIKKKAPSQDKRSSVKRKISDPNKEILMGSNVGMDHLKQKKIKVSNLRGDLKGSFTSSKETQPNGNIGSYDHHKQELENSDCPSKFLNLCLNTIEEGLLQDATCCNDGKRPLFVNPWGVEFLKCYSIGTNVLETGGSCSSKEQIAWMVSVAADAISRKEKKDQSFTSPFLLFLVPSQEKAAQVRSMCRPLKALGIHTVSLHPGASLNHQIHGLKSCEPEYLVSTPERLLELLSFKAVDVSGVSFLVVDGLDSFDRDNRLSALTSIRQSISGNPYTIVFNNSFNCTCIPALKYFFPGPISRLSLNDSIPNQSACIVQTINVCTFEPEKFLKVLDQLKPLKVLYIVGSNSKSHSLVRSPKLGDYSVSNASSGDLAVVDSSLSSASGTIEHRAYMINMEDISTVDLGIYEIVILPDFVPSIDKYVQILTNMARHTISGQLHVFFKKENALLAGELIEVLEQCEQAVPEMLRDLHRTSHTMKS